MSGSPLEALQGRHVAVLGATGLAGRVLVKLLEEHGVQDLALFATSFGDVDGRRVEPVSREALEEGGFDVVFLAVSAEAAPALAEAALRGGALVVDKSSAHRETAPLVVPEVNPEAARGHRLLASPNCCVVPLTCVLKPLEDHAGLKSVRVASYQSASGAGRGGLDRLEEESLEDHDVRFDWRMQEGADSEEEAKIAAETRRVLGRESLAVSATCLRVPVTVGHGLAVFLELERDLSVPEVQALLLDAPSLSLAYAPTPRLARGRDDVLVGRVKRLGPGQISLFVACDNLRKGAALNAVQIAELALARP